MASGSAPDLLEGRTTVDRVVHLVSMDEDTGHNVISDGKVIPVVEPWSGRTAEESPSDVHVLLDVTAAVVGMFADVPA